jgi:hypothetical protein
MSIPFERKEGRKWLAAIWQMPAGKTDFVITDRLIGVTGRRFVGKKVLSRETLINGLVAAVKFRKSESFAPIIRGVKAALMAMIVTNRKKSRRRSRYNR